MCLCEQLLYYSTSTCFDGVSSAVKSECVVLVYNNDNYSDKGDSKKCRRKKVQGNPDRMKRLSRPTARQLQSCDERCSLLAPRRRDNIKSALEEDYFITPEQTEEYFRALQAARVLSRKNNNFINARKENERQTCEMRQREQWLISFSAQVAYRLCDYVTRGQKELLFSNRLCSTADFVLERVAEILGEPKPSRACGGRLARFMVAVSDRIAVWIEEGAHRASTLGAPTPLDRSEARLELDAAPASPEPEVRM